MNPDGATPLVSAKFIPAPHDAGPSRDGPQAVATDTLLVFSGGPLNGVTQILSIDVAALPGFQELIFRTTGEWEGAEIGCRPVREWVYRRDGWASLSGDVAAMGKAYFDGRPLSDRPNVLVFTLRGNSTVMQRLYNTRAELDEAKRLRFREMNSVDYWRDIAMQLRRKKRRPAEGHGLEKENRTTKREGSQVNQESEGATGTTTERPPGSRLGRNLDTRSDDPERDFRLGHANPKKGNLVARTHVDQRKYCAGRLRDDVECRSYDGRSNNDDAALLITDRLVDGSVVQRDPGGVGVLLGVGLREEILAARALVDRLAGSYRLAGHAVRFAARGLHYVAWGNAEVCHRLLLLVLDCPMFALFDRRLAGRLRQLQQGREKLTPLPPRAAALHVGRPEVEAIVAEPTGAARLGLLGARPTRGKFRLDPGQRAAERAVRVGLFDRQGEAVGGGLHSVGGLRAVAVWGFL